MLLKKYKAGALQLTLFIIVIITLLLASFLILLHTHKHFNGQTSFIIETTKNTNKGVNYVLNNSVALNDTTSINLKDEDYKSLKVHRSFWGVFEKVTSVSTIKNNTFKKVGLIGGKQPDNNRTALYIQDNSKPLVLVGNTKIEGVAYLPELGVKAGTISGQSYYGSQLIYGTKRLSSTLPKVLNETTSQLKAIETQYLRTREEQFLNLEDQKTYANSFFKPTQVVFSNSQLSLSAVNLTGNIIVQSKTKIVVEATSKLKDVILIAPKIEIKESVKGKFQALASKNILVERNVILDYPSALILNEKEKTIQTLSSNQIAEQNNIIINSNSSIKGLVMFLGQPEVNNFNAQIELKEESTVIGEVYCNRNLELLGTVYGTVYTNNFVARQFGSIYQNHIYNGTIIVNKLQSEFSGILFNNSKKEVAKWMY